MNKKVNFNVRTQAHAYSEGMKDAMAMLIDARVNGHVDDVIDLMEHNARPEDAAKLRAFYAEATA